MWLTLVTLVLLCAADAASDRSLWVEPNQLKAKSKKTKTASQPATRRNAAKAKEELMPDEDDLFEYTTDENVLELLDNQRQLMLSWCLSFSTIDVCRREK